MSTSRDFRLYVLKDSAISEGDLAMGFSAFGTSPSRDGWLIIFIIRYLCKKGRCQFSFGERRCVVRVNSRCIDSSMR